MSACERRDQKLRVRYGISLEIYRQMVKNQHGRCAICNKHATLIVDHSHGTGKVRGLLCNNCNGGIGLLKEKRNIIESAMHYLDRWSQ
jgi:hypothetical protein